MLVLKAPVASGPCDARGNDCGPERSLRTAPSSSSSPPAAVPSDSVGLIDAPRPAGRRHDRLGWLKLHGRWGGWCAWRSGHGRVGLACLAGPAPGRPRGRPFGAYAVSCVAGWRCAQWLRCQGCRMGGSRKTRCISKPPPTARRPSPPHPPDGDAISKRLPAFAPATTIEIQKFAYVLYGRPRGRKVRAGQASALTTNLAVQRTKTYVARRRGRCGGEQPRCAQRNPKGRPKAWTRMRTGKSGAKAPDRNR